MDRNSIIGLLLIGAVLLGYTYYMAPTEAEVQAYKKQQDSIAAVELDKIKEQQITNETIISNADTAIVGDSNDSLVLAENVSKYGIFANSAVGENEYYTIENELIKGVVSSKGGRLVSVELKDYKTFRGDPLILFDEDSSKFNASFYSNNKFINTENLLFDADGSSLEVSGSDEKSLSMKLFADDRSKYVEYIYSIKGGSYVVDYQVNFVGLQDVVQENTSEIELNWSIKGLNNEKNIDTERNTSSIFYKYQDEEVDWLSETSADNGDFEAKMHWLSFKQQYFSAALICNEGFDKDKADMSVKPLNSSKYTKYYETNLMLPFSRGANSSEQMSFYFGPNHFQTLEDLNIDLEDQINLGWGIFGWMNEFVVIPVFNILDGFNWSYGIIILVLTLLIKMVLFPITYKNYLSSAKMRVLKPEIDELNEKNKDADAMKKQQETKIGRAHV